MAMLGNQISICAETSVMRLMPVHLCPMPIMIDHLNADINSYGSLVSVFNVASVVPNNVRLRACGWCLRFSATTCHRGAPNDKPVPARSLRARAHNFVLPPKDNRYFVSRVLHVYEALCPYNC